MAIDPEPEALNEHVYDHDVELEGDEDLIDLASEDIYNGENLLEFPAAANPIDSSHILHEILHHQDFQFRIALCADRAEIEGIHDANQPFRTSNHRGIRAQQQMVQHLGEWLIAQHEFEEVEINNQKSFLGPEGSFSSRIQFIHVRSQFVAGGFTLGAKGRVQAKQLTHQNQACLDLDFGDDIDPCHANTRTVFILTRCQGERIKVHLFLPTHFVGKRWLGHNLLCYEGTIGMISSLFESFGASVELSPDGTIPQDNDSYVQEIAANSDIEPEPYIEIDDVHSSQTGAAN